MLTRLLFLATLLSLAMLPVVSLSAEEPSPPTCGACLPVESAEMQGLLGVIQRTVSSDAEGPTQRRARWFEGRKMPPGAVMPVLEEAVCAKVVRTLKAYTAFSDSTADVLLRPGIHAGRRHDLVGRD